MTTYAQQDFAFAFLSILLEGAPFILLGTLISGLIDVYLPKGVLDSLLPRQPIAAVAVAGLLGIVLPVCECAVVPVIRRLVKKGLPVSCGLTYMLAAPIVNPITALSTWKAFKGPVVPLGEEIVVNANTLMTSSRLGLGYLIAVAVGIIVLKIPLAKILRPRLLNSIETDTVSALASHEQGECCGGHDHHHQSSAPTNRLVAAFRSSLRDFADVGVYFVIGVSITALFNTGIAPGAEWLDSLASDPIAAPAALMLLAFILSLCSTSDAFIAAALHNFTWGAKLAFLTLGPMMDVKLIFLYQTVLKRRFIIILAVGLFLLIGGSCIAWQAVLTSLVPR